ncbi:MAG: GNAT family N-acetyltransferase [Candidatus Eremiobacteraeota bacterium]|nr:GNAT family N-acetyltransferase [Candidatus Eremiobacteraeota bacterium]MBV8365251.1 GNAT family N-acetyltransferase [Candidatus Eremiobacteraeota bacterium]
MALTIRKAVAADRKFVDDLGGQSAYTSISPLRAAGPGDAAAAFARATQFYADRADGVTFIAECDGERAGFIMLLFDLTDDVTLTSQAFVVYMAVASAQRRRGIARSLLAAAEEEARTRGVSHISLMVTQANTPARSLYEQAGYLDERVQMTKRLERTKQ